MNDLDDLRRTLDAHADDLRSDLTTVERSSAVHGRVRVVRRRRRAAAVGALAAVLVAGGAGALVHRPDGTDAAPATTVVGVVVPPHLSAVGYTYDLVQTVSGPTGRAHVTLPPSTSPRLVSWATSGDVQRVRIAAPQLDAPSGQVSSPDFEDYLYVPPSSSSQSVSVMGAAGETGLAVYTLGASRPAGVTGDGLTFRREITGGHLLGATIGRPGQDEVQVSAVADGRGLDVVALCTGAPNDAYVHVEKLTGKGVFDADPAGCGDPLPYDALAASMVHGISARPGQDVGMRLWLTKGLDGPRISQPGMRLALGIFSLDGDPDAPAPPAAVENAGHAWVRTRVLLAAPGQHHLRAVTPPDGGMALAIAFSRVGSGGSAVYLASGSQNTGMGGAGGGQLPLVLGDGAAVRVSRPHGNSFGVALYRRADAPPTTGS